MSKLTPRQKEVFGFLCARQREHGVVPSLREIARHFGFKSMTAAADHVRALRQKGYLAHEPRLARSHRVLLPLHSARGALLNIPLYGTIPAGFAIEQEQEAQGGLSVDAQSLGVAPGAQVFALRVRGDSMIGRHILDGDTAIIERGPAPRPGDVVAALIDNESTLKTFLVEKGQPFLRAENPHYSDLIPATELVVQGILVGLVRRCR